MNYDEFFNSLLGAVYAAHSIVKAKRLGMHRLDPRRQERQQPQNSAR